MHYAKFIIEMLPVNTFSRICRIIWNIWWEIGSQCNSWPAFVTTTISGDQSVDNFIITTVGNSLRTPFMVSYRGAYRCYDRMAPNGTTYVLRTMRNNFFMPVHITDGFVYIAYPTISLLTSFRFSRYALCDPNLMNTITRECLWKLRRFQLLMAIRLVFDVVFGWVRAIVD